MRISITVLVVAVLAACASNDAQSRTSGLALAVEPTPSGPGEEIALVLRNGSSSQVGYNLCTARLSQQRGEHWVVVDPRRDCTAEQQALEPGAEDRYDLQLPAELDGGSYRFSVRVEVGGTRIEEIYSPSFQMPEPAQPDTADAEAANPS